MVSLVLFFPLLCALIVTLIPNEKWVRPIALGLSIIEFVFSLHFIYHFKPSADLQFTEKFSWIEQFNISYFVGIDGLSIWLVLLSTFLVPVIILASWETIGTRIKTFHACMFVLLTAMLGSFVSLDLILYYCFWELSLIPMYLIVGIWGGPKRIYASIKFFIFTMLGSVFMLLAMIALMFLAQEQLGQITSNVLDLYKLQIPFVEGTFFNPQILLFLAFAAAFAIKVPMFPVHTWLPDAHTEAPTPGSVILAGVMLKMGTFGFIRFAMPLFPEAVHELSWLFLFLGVLGIIYGALVAMVQPDIKKLVAYSSVSHMGYVMIGLFALNTYGTTGALYQMLNHGISTGALFFLVGMIYERTHSRKIEDYGGLAKAMPIYTIFFVIVTMSSIAVPGTNGFIGEYLILMGTFMTDKLYGAFAVTGVVFGAAYMLWMVKKVFFGPAGKLVEGQKLPDLNWREISVMTIMTIMIFWMGIYPKFFLDVAKPSVDQYTQTLDKYALKVMGAEAGE
ncbi:MAG: NADH-quinone oxidoreductase subunit M [Bdellovibrionales bacterium]|nr:NADH-quinone oxidoreductase subunit M [Bdellovibrionales bacterium]